MAKKKSAYKPPFLEITLSSEGQRVFHLLAKEPLMVTASHFAAHYKLHEDARPRPVAITLFEAGMALLSEGHPAREYIQTAVAQLVMDELPMTAFIEWDKGDELPF